MGDNNFIDVTNCVNGFLEHKKDNYSNTINKLNEGINNL